MSIEQTIDRANETEILKERIKDLVERYKREENKVKRLDIRSELNNLTKLDSDLDLILEEDEIDPEIIIGSMADKQDLIKECQEKTGISEGLENFGIEELNNLILQTERGDREKINNLIKEIEQKPLPENINKEIEFDPEKVVNQLDALTKDGDIKNHYQAGELIKKLNGEQAAQVMAKINPELEGRLKKIDEPEFGRMPKKADEFRSLNSSEREDLETMKAYDKYVIDTKTKKAPRGYEAEKKDGSNDSQENKSGEKIFGRAPRKVDEFRTLSSSEREDLETMKAYDKYVIDTKTKKAPRGHEANDKGKGTEDVNDITMPLPEARENNGVNEGAKEEVKDPEEIKRNEKNEKVDKKLAEFFNEEGKNATFSKEIAAQTAKTVLGSVASIVGVKSFYDVPAYFRQRFGVRGNVMGIGKGKGIEGSMEELLAKSQKNYQEVEDGKERRNKEGGAMDSIKDLDKRLAMTREGSKKNSEQRNLIAKLLWENRHKEKMAKDERHGEIKTILDDYTTTKVTGIQATREALNTAFVGLSVPTGFTSMKLRALMYIPLSAIGKRDEIKKKARIEARKEGKNETEIKEADKKADIFEAIKKGVIETYTGALGKGEGTKKEKIFRAIKAYGNIARFAGIVGTALVTPGAYGEAIDKVIKALGEEDTWTEAGDNFINGSVERLTFGALNNNEDLGQNSNPEIDEKTESLNMNETEVSSIASPYQGGNSVWKESKNQLRTILGEGADEKMVNRMTQFVVREPEKYGLPEDVNFNDMSADQIKNIDWEKALLNATGNEKLPEIDIADVESAEVQPELNINDIPGNQGVIDNIDAEASHETIEDLYNPDGTINHEKYFQTEEGAKEASRLNELAEKYFKASHNRANPTARNLAFGELKKEIANLENKIGGKVTYNGQGDIFLNFAGNRQQIFNGELDRIINNNENNIIENVEENDSDHSIKFTLDGRKFNTASPFHLKKLARHFDRRMDKFIESDDGQEQLRILSKAGRKYFDENISPEERKELMDSVSWIRKEIGEKLHCRTNMTPEGDVQLIGFVEKKIPAESLFENPDRLFGQKIASEEIPIEENKEELDFQEADDGKLDYAENDDLSKLKADLNENNFGIIDNEIKPDFADKYSPLEQENLTKYVNSEIEERNELLDFLEKYKSKYGDRPKFSAFRRMVENNIGMKNGQIVGMLKGFSDPLKNYQANISEIGQGGPKALAADLAERLAEKSGLLSKKEIEDNVFEEMERMAKSN